MLWKVLDIIGLVAVIAGSGLLAKRQLEAKAYTMGELSGMEPPVLPWAGFS